MYRIFLAFICLTLAACGGNDGTTSTPDQGILADVGPVEDTGPDGGIQDAADVGSSGEIR